MRSRRKAQNRTASKPTSSRHKRPRTGAIYRQGDVLLRRVENPDLSGAQRIEPEKGRIVLAHGEATGHAHAVSGAHALLWGRKEVRLLEVRKGTALQHEEHDPIALAPGLYEVIRQREFTDAPGPTRGNDAHSLWRYADGAWRVVRD